MVEFDIWVHLGYYSYRGAVSLIVLTEMSGNGHAENWQKRLDKFRVDADSNNIIIRGGEYA
jgi:hypothetical protein